jgi:hypothetical protein
VLWDGNFRCRHQAEFEKNSVNNIQDQIEGITMQKIERNALATTQAAGGCCKGGSNNSSKSNSVVIIYR